MRDFITLVLFILLVVTGLMAWGFGRDYVSALEELHAVKHQRDALLVKHEGYRWLGDELIAVKFPPPPNRND